VAKPTKDAHHICEPIFSVPWEGDGWHLATYWIDGRGYTYDSCSDGDHESVLTRDLPTWPQQRQSWIEYFEFVLATGTDPIGVIMLPSRKRKEEVWHFRFSPSILGYVCIAARHGRQQYGGPWNKSRKMRHLNELPDYVHEFLNTEKGRHRLVLRDFNSTEGKKEFEQLFPKPRKWNRQELTSNLPPLSDRTIERHLRKVARRSIQQHEQEIAQDRARSIEKRRATLAAKKGRNA